MARKRTKSGRFTKTRKSSSTKKGRKYRYGDPARGLMGAVINVGVGALAGAISNFGFRSASVEMRPWVQPIVYIPIGILAGNETLETFGGLNLGSSIVDAVVPSSRTSTAVARY